MEGVLYQHNPLYLESEHYGMKDARFLADLSPGDAKTRELERAFLHPDGLGKVI